MAALWVWECRVREASGRWSSWFADPTVVPNTRKIDALNNKPRDEDETKTRLSKYVREWHA